MNFWICGAACCAMQRIRRREGEKNRGTKATVPRLFSPSLARARADRYHMPSAGETTQTMAAIRNSSSGTMRLSTPRARPGVLGSFEALLSRASKLPRPPGNPRRSNSQCRSTTKPPADAQSFALCLQHLMFPARRQKANHSSRDRLDVDKMPIRCMNSQDSAIGGLPFWIQIQHQGHFALRASLRLIDVAAISGTGRIPRIVELQLKQPQERVAVQLQPQFLEALEQPAFRPQQRLAQPASEIAADVVAAPLRTLPADAGRREVPARLASPRALPQFQNLSGGSKLISNRDAARTKLSAYT
jgi:hypothetical protein